MSVTDEYKKTHLMEMPKADLETVYEGLTPAVAAAITEADTEVITDTGVATTADIATDTPAEEVALDEVEKKLLTIIPTLDDYEGVGSEMIANTFLKKFETTHSIPFDLGRKIFRSLRKKGYYDTKGKADGKVRTTFQLTALGVQYLTDNNLLTAATADAPTKDVFDANIWLNDLRADYGDVTSEMLDELVATEMLTQSQAEEIYDLSCRAA
jgi:hypothetical protein